MKYLHTMVRVSDVEASPALLLRRPGAQRAAPYRPRGRPLHADLPGRAGRRVRAVELTHNWDESGYTGGRNFGHLAYAVPNV